uniref:Tetraspanin n=1 Tax=Hemiscolopendra marginata TaxID=943146 RepID=A0A646QC03_9MYRI
MVSASMKVIKYLLFIFNFIFFITGAVLLGIGIYVQVHTKNYLSFAGPHYLTAAVILIVVGCIITVIGFFGCCGACKESHCMMITFSVLLGLIFVLELAAGIAAYVLRNDLDNIIKENMKKSLNRYNSTADDKKTWDMLQNEFDCCGIDNDNDWKENNLPIPDSCCKEESAGCALDKHNLNTKGCYDKFKNAVVKYAGIIGGIGIGIAFVQIIGIVCACCLASAIKREYEIV